MRTARTVGLLVAAAIGCEESRPSGPIVRVPLCDAPLCAIPCACDETTACDPGCDGCDTECGGCRAPAGPCRTLDAGTAFDGAVADASPAPDCTDLPRSQTLSAPCCPEHGPDACGAQLFCAAFDGRQQPTCYAERSRADRAECAEDRHCLSGSCNAEKRQCRSAPGTACSGEVGCGADPQGRRYFCLGGVCTATGDGSAGALCERDEDCDSGRCGADVRCMAGLGADCEDAACAAGTCVPCSADNVECIDGLHRSECLRCCSDSFGRAVFQASCATGVQCPAPCRQDLASCSNDVDCCGHQVPYEWGQTDRNYCSSGTCCLVDGTPSTRAEDCCSGGLCSSSPSGGNTYCCF